MNLVIDPHNGVPMTDQLVTGISGLIRSRQMLAGVKLPSIRALAATQKISRFPVIEAYDRLSSLGFIVPKHGSVSTWRTTWGVRAVLRAARILVLPRRNRIRSCSSST